MRKSEPLITRSVYFFCLAEIVEYADFRLLGPQFKLRNIDFPHFLFDKRSSHQSGVVERLALELDQIKDGYQIFYQCLKETVEQSPDHGALVKSLEERGMVPVYPYKRLQVLGTEYVWRASASSS